MLFVVIESSFLSKTECIDALIFLHIHLNAKKEDVIYI